RGSELAGGTIRVEIGRSSRGVESPPGAARPQRPAARLSGSDTIARHTQEAEPMAHRVTFIPGDGVGPELSEATRRVLEGTGVAFDWDVQEAGADVMDKFGTPLPEDV